MEEVGVAEQFLFAPHDFLAANRDRIQHGVAHFVRQLLRPLLDNRVTGIGVLIDGMAEAHDLFLALEHAQQALLGLVRGLELFNQRHGRLVGAAVQRTAQGANGTGHTAVDV